MKKGFTLVELLAVIVLLSIIALIATPIVSNSIDTARERLALAEAEMVLKGIADYCSGEDIKVRTGEIKKEDRICTNIDSVNVKKMVKNIKKDTTVSYAKYKDGKVTSLIVIKNDVTYVLKTDGNLEKATNNCIFDGDLVDNVTYTKEQYTYTYKQSLGGWKVELTDKESTDPVTSNLCPLINSRPIVSMEKMFSNSNTTNIDVSSFDTSNVTNMSDMFSSMSQPNDSENIIITGLTTFDTSNVTDMSGMFSVINTSVDVSNFNTSKVTNMSSMFMGSYTTVNVIGLKSFNTSNVTDMSYMFMFSGFDDISSFDTKNVTNMSGMFQFASLGQTLDLSNFNTSNVTDMNMMFSETGVSTVYVKTQADADRFNNLGTNITFQVK